MSERINYVIARPLDKNNVDDPSIVIYFVNSDEVMNDAPEDAKKIVESISNKTNTQYFVYELVRRDS